MKQQNKESMTATNYSELPSEVSFSLGFKRFWSDLEKDSKGFQFEDYTPSTELIERYNLTKIDGVYCLNGFMKIDEGFDKDMASSIKCNMVSYTSEINTFHIPVVNVPKLVKMKKLKSIETSIKVHLK